LSRNIPGFGICFGHQLLGLHLGSPVRTDPTRAEVGTLEMELTERGRHDPLFSGLGEKFTAHTGHSDHVSSTPAELELLATSETLDTQAFRLKGGRFYTTQFHPDLTGAEAIDRYRAIVAKRPEASANLARFRAGEDTTASLLSGFLNLLAQ